MEWRVTPLEISTFARQQYNAVSDSFFADAELYNHLYFAQTILAKEAKLVENVYTTTTVASQQEYTYPTTAIAIKRVTYDGKDLMPIKMGADQLLTGNNADTTGTGTPYAYFIFDKTIYLRPVPAAAETLKIYSYDMPSAVSATSTLDVPSEFHVELANYLLWKMAAKDQNFQSAALYKSEWEATVVRAKAWTRKRATANGFNVVIDEDAFYDPWRLP